jgi:hypothetical protein
VTEPGANYLPLKVGASWSYNITNGAGMTGQGTMSVEASESPPAGGDPALRVRTTLIGAGTLVWESVSDPGVIRFQAQDLNASGSIIYDKQYSPAIIVLDESAPHLSAGASWTENYTETKKSSKKVKTSPETVEWTTEAVGESVTVPAGTFSCIRVRGTHTTSKTPSSEVAWYAQGVGKVRETGAGPSNDQTLELSGYMLP